VPAPPATAGQPRSRSLPRYARHGQAELLLGHFRSVLPDDAPLVDDEDAIREREDLVELQRDEQDGLSAVARLDEPPMDVLDRSDVEAARRLRGQQDAG